MSSTNALIVPMDVAALCATTKDAGDGVTMMTPMADFSDLPQAPQPHQPVIETPYLASVVMKSAQPREIPAGIHLHWALPVGLTAGTPGADGSLTFPQAPNRWLVSRFSILDGAVTPSFTVIESDRLSSDAVLNGNLAPVTVPLDPTQTTGAEVNYAYLGAMTPLQQWSETSYTAFHLTAVGWGEQTFASYYPNCSSVFGYFDPAASLDEGATLLYHVSGWYDGTVVADPLASPPTPLPYGWTCPNGAPDGAVLSGFIGGITWNSGQPGITQTAGQLTAAIGNSTVEALSALLANLNGGGAAAEAAAQSLLNALQLQTLGQTGQVLASTESALHAAGFSALQGGTRWLLQPNAGNGAPPIPASVASLLNQLNAAQALLDAENAAAATGPAQLFDLWCQYLTANTSPGSDKPLKASQLGTLQKWIAERAAALTAAPGQPSAQQQAVGGLVGQIEALLTAEWPTSLPYSLTQSGNAPRYYAPHDPVVVLKGDDVAPTGRYTGGVTGASLACRIQGDLVSALTIADGGGNSATITGAADAVAALLPSLPATVPTGVLAAVTEAALIAPPLSSWLVTQMAALPKNPLPQADVATAQTALPEVAKQFCGLVPLTFGGVSTYDSGGLTFTFGGSAPDPLLASGYDGAPWLPMMMEWSVSVTPLQDVTGGGQYGKTVLTGGTFAFPEDGVDLGYTGAAAPGGVAFTDSGINTLSGQAPLTLGQAIAAWLAANPDSGFASLLEELDDHALLAQSLSGFTQHLLTQQTTFQLPPFNPLDTAAFQTGGTFGSLAAAIGVANGTSPELAGSFNPVMGGLFSLTGLTLIDAFGRTLSYSTSGSSPTLSVIVGQSLAVPDGLASLSPAPDAFLPPRLAQPASLTAGWLPVNGTGIETTGDPVASPVLGIVVPGRANGELLVYGPGGAPLVVLAPGASGSQVLVAPGSGFAPNVSAATVLAGQPALLNSFVTAMGGAGSLVSGLTAAVAEAQSTILPPASAQMANLAAYVGQPLVLAQISLACSLQGAAALDQTWSALGSWLDDPSAAPDAGIGAVSLPVSLGLASSLGDGLVGYWLVGSDGTPDFSTFYAPAGPAGDGVALPDIGTLTLTAGTPGTPVSVLALFDPRGSVAVVTGVLPVQTLSLPPAQYSAALGSLSVALPVGPAPDGGTTGVVTLPLPALQTGSWSWTAPGAGGWTASTLADATLNAPLFPGNPQTLAEGWLVIAASGDN